jgi:predicted nucleotidyltransferase
MPGKINNFMDVVNTRESSHCAILNMIFMKNLSIRSDHERAGAVFGSLNGWEIPFHYGDKTKEYQSAKESCAISDLSYRGKLRVAGADRTAFLHNMLTNDIKALSPGKSCYSALLTDRAKMVSDMYVFAFVDYYLLDIEPGVLEKALQFIEKYIVAYVLAGSIVQGKATPESDIDVFIVIDDTDVKRMTRAELKDKLRAIIIGMGVQAGEITGIRNKINIQVYILTDFWESIKEAHPVIFTFLRDGVPFYDRGIFMPWKQLLKMGRIKPLQRQLKCISALESS